MSTSIDHIRAIENVHGSRVVSSFSSFTGDIFYVLANGKTGTWKTRTAS